MGAVASVTQCSSGGAESKSERAWLNVVAFVPQERRSDMDRLMVEQGQAWCNGAGFDRRHAPLMRYSFSSDRLTMERMHRSLRAMLEAMDVKFHSFIFPCASGVVG